MGVPAIFVPLPIGNGEQALNARSLVESSAALLVKDAEVTGEWFAREIPALMANPEELERMGAAAYELGIRDAASVMAEAVLKAAEK